jgi:Cof subfamily protein (haloacid dehalogenase superfamily)
MGKYDGWLIVSDMDGTLLTDNHDICRRNIEAVQKFKAQGGKFTVATGRVMPAVKMYLDRTAINAPAIMHNGAKIYDFETNTTLFSKPIEEYRKPILKRVFKEQPHLGIEVYTASEETYVYQHCAETARFKLRGYDVCYELPDEIWDVPWIKGLIIGDKDVLDEFEPIYRTEYDTGFSVRSGDKFLDIVSGDVGKGKALLKVADMLGIDHRKTIAIGDNMNDIDMLEKAAIGVAVANAEEAVKRAADYVVCSNNDGAIADVLNIIEKFDL